MIVALLLRYWQSAALVAALGFGGIMWHRHNIAEVDKGVALERARVADSARAAILVQLAHAETVYVRDTIRLSHTLTRTSTLRDTLLLHLTDTVRVKEFIAQTRQDSVACVEAANSCADKLRLKDREIATLTSQLGLQPALHKESHIGFGATLGLGATKPLNGPLAVGPSLTAGVTVRW